MITSIWSFAVDLFAWEEYEPDYCDH